MQRLAIGTETENNEQARFEKIMASAPSSSTRSFDPRSEISADARYIVRWLVILLFVIPVIASLAWILLKMLAS